MKKTMLMASALAAWITAPAFAGQMGGDDVEGSMGGDPLDIDTGSEPKQSEPASTNEPSEAGESGAIQDRAIAGGSVAPEDLIEADEIPKTQPPGVVNGQ